MTITTKIISTSLFKNYINQFQHDNLSNKLMNWSFLRTNINLDNDKYVIIMLNEDNDIIGYAMFSNLSISKLYSLIYFGKIPTVELSLFEIRKDYQNKGLSKILTNHIDNTLNKETIFINGFSRLGVKYKLPNRLKSMKNNKVIFREFSNLKNNVH